MPFSYSVSNQAIATDVTTLLGRLTAARATALDELLAANMPLDLTNIYDRLGAPVLADLSADIAAGLAAERGTDNGLLAANYETFGAELADQVINQLTYFFLDAGYLLTGFTIENVDIELRLEDQEDVVFRDHVDVPFAADTFYTYFFVSDGGNIGFVNTNVGTPYNITYAAGRFA